MLDDSQRMNMSILTNQINKSCSTVKFPNLSCSIIFPTNAQRTADKIILCYIQVLNKTEWQKGGVKMKKMIALAGLLASVFSACAGSSGNRMSDDEMMQYHNLLAKEEVKQVVNRLFISTDNRDWDTVKQLFAPTVLFDVTSMVGGDPVTMTPGDIVAAWDKGLKPLKAIHHQAGNYIVSVDQDRAEVFCYGIASHYLPNKTNLNTRIFVGSYNFHLTMNSDTWQIDKFKFNLKYIDGNPNLEASQQ